MEAASPAIQLALDTLTKLLITSKDEKLLLRAATALLRYALPSRKPVAKPPTAPSTAPPAASHNPNDAPAARTSNITAPAATHHAAPLQPTLHASTQPPLAILAGSDCPLHRPLMQFAARHPTGVPTPLAPSVPDLASRTTTYAELTAAIALPQPPRFA